MFTFTFAMQNTLVVGWALAAHMAIQGFDVTVYENNCHSGGRFSLINAENAENAK